MRDSSLTYFDKALSLAKIHNDSSQIALIKQNTGVFFWKTGNFSLARENLQSALFFNQTKKQETIIYLNLAQIYNDMNLKDSAEYCTNRVLSSLEKEKDLPSLSNAYHLLSSMEEKAGNYKKALQFHQEYSNLLAAIFRENKGTNLQEIEKKYNFERIRNEKNKLMIEIQWAAIIILILFVAIILFYWNTMRNKAIHLKKEVDLSEAKQKIYELQELANHLDERENNLRNLIAKYLDIYRKASSTEREMNENKKLSGKEFVQKMNKILYGQVEHDWDKLYQAMDGSYSGFFSKLKEQYSQLTESEHKICCLTYAGFDNTEIALNLDLAKNTIQQRKSEIRQKLNIEERGNIKTFFDNNINKG
jgi:ATP/maltotriose-dependent transcriptional regulator MalT